MKKPRVKITLAESFFATLKKEELYRSRYKSVYEFTKAVDRYIEFYNNLRVHSYLGYLSPVQYEAKFCGKNDNDQSV